MNLSVRFFAVAAIAALAACGGHGATQALPLTGLGPTAATTFNQIPPEFGTYRRVCDAGPRAGYSECYAIQRIDSAARMSADTMNSGSNTCGEGIGVPGGCFGPPGLQKLYNIVSASKTGGKGVTVALVDAYGYPGVQDDLNTYRKFFSLPACGKGCFTVVNQKGKTKPLPKVNTTDDWRGEQALDIDMVSAICPNCKILLVQTDDNGNGNLADGVDAAVKLGADIVSNSYGCPENYCTPAATNPSYDHTGVLIVASAGDSGAEAAQPCDLSTIICVGGTSVAVSKSGHFAESVWDGLVKNQCGGGPCATGSGCSSIVEKPSWQHDKGCTWRSESDLSAVADPYTGVIVSCEPCTGDPTKPLSSGHGGTSASSPIIAAMYALAGNAKSQSGATLWAHNGKGFNDVTSGTNSKKGDTFVCPKSYAYICKAGKGYDGPTGWGSPNGVGSL